MKKIFVVIVREENGKFYAMSDAIQTGNNLVPFVERYNAKIMHLCESRKEADMIALEWNRCYKENETNLY